MVAVLISGCVSSQNVGSSAEHIWIKDAFLSLGGAQDIADEHCAKYAKNAVLESEMQVSDGAPVLAFACK